MSKTIQRLVNRLGSLRIAITNMGLWETIAYALQRLIYVPLIRPESIRVRSKTALYPLVCRVKSSDIDVFGQIFLAREYRCLDDVESPALIIDCGANCGYSAAYFLTRFSNAHLVAVEPDPGNFSVLQQNIRPYGDRAKAIRAGVWSESTGLVLEDSSMGDGREWARSVRAARVDEISDIQATDISTLLADSGFTRISILKIDIEGSEFELFKSGPPAWISTVDNMVIEIHGDRCKDAVLGALSKDGFEVTRCDELTVFKRTRGRAP